jgi:hypothetical protein
MYDDVVIFSWNNMLWRAGYTISAENKATLDDPTRVKLYYAPIDAQVDNESLHEIDDPARLFADNSHRDDDEEDGDDVEESLNTESQELVLAESESIPLHEAAVKPDGTAKICLITPGWGSKGYYSKEVLQRDGPLAFPSGTHMHFDHPTDAENRARPERSLSTLAAVLKEDAHYDEDGPNGEGLYAEVSVFADKRPVLNEIAKHIGTSIFAYGLGQEGEREGRKGRIVEALLPRPTNTVDFVTKAGRGGKVLELVESARAKIDGPVTHKIEKIQENREVNTEMTSEEIQAMIRESVATAVADATGQAQTQITQLEATIARQNDALRLREARDVAVVEVAKFRDLGPRARDRVVSLALNGDAPLTESGELDTAKVKTNVEAYAKAEIEYLTEAGVGNGKIIGMGAESTPELNLEEAQASLVEVGQMLGLSETAAKRFAS